MVAQGIRYSGFRGGEDNKDYYAIGIQEESDVIVDLWSNSEYPAQASIYDGERHFLDIVSIQYGTHDNTSVRVLEAQTIYLEISTTGTYDFQITLEKIGDSNDGATDTTIFEQFEDFMGMSFVFFMFLVIVFIVIIAVIAYILKRR